MFGHQNNDQDNQQNNQSPTVSNDMSDNSQSAPAEPFNPALPMSNGGSFGNSINPLPPVAPEAPVIEASSPSNSSPDDKLFTPIGSDDLMNIKQQALNQLSPLVGHLDQTPEEKFRTTMMMIQASDNQDLVKDAYAAAQEITDEKAKAQALLDIVNEINYFTQHHQA